MYAMESNSNSKSVNAEGAVVARRARRGVLLSFSLYEAYERLLKADVKYPFSIDMASLKSA